MGDRRLGSCVLGPQSDPPHPAEGLSGGSTETDPERGPREGQVVVYRQSLLGRGLLGLQADGGAGVVVWHIPPVSGLPEIFRVSGAGAPGPGQFHGGMI